MVTRAIVLGFAALALSAAAGRAETASPQPRDVTAVQNCLKSQRGKELKGERCIGVVADPCLKTSRSTADSNACSDRETAVWVTVLDAAYTRLRAELDEEQKGKAEAMQRAWTESREKTCGFYWDYHQGSMASPMSAYCTMRETARRALFIKDLVEAAGP